MLTKSRRARKMSRLIGCSASGRRYNRSSMKARVFVSLKPTVLDPQGATIRSALNGMGYSGIADVRQGKFFDIDIAESGDTARIREEIDRIAHEVLSNPVIEEYRIEIAG